VIGVARAGYRLHRGFTLIEVLVTMTLVAAIAGMLSFAIVGRLDSVRVATAARDLAAALRYTRSQAILHREEKYLEIDLERRSYTAPGKQPVALPESLELKLLTASSEVSSDQVGRIRFFADGGSTGGRVTLNAGARQWQVKVSWLTGEIQLDDGRDRR
jgi:general secretion pathway protein H